MTVEHASRLAAGWVADPSAVPWRELTGSAVLADLSGFTRLTERLTGTGAEGVETLHEVVSQAFARLLGTSVALGGDVIGFAGDAALVWFGADEHPDHAVRAAEAAVRMPADLATLPAALTGRRRLRVSVGVHTGQFQAALAGTPRRRALFMCGPAMSTLAGLQAAAPADQVLASHGVAAAVGPAMRVGEVGPGVRLRRAGRARVAGAVTDVPAASLASDGLLSPAVRELLDSGGEVGTHRTVSVGFVRVGGLDAVVARDGAEGAHRLLDSVVACVTDVAGDESVEWLDVDVGVDIVKLLLTAGAPSSHEYDEDHLLLALRRVIDECDVPLAAGAHRGRVYAALLGVPGRRAYTLLGDPVNVAARALALAGDRQLVVGDALASSAMSFVEAEPLGAKVLRNRAQPVGMWRVTTVARRPLSRRSSTSVLSTRMRRREADVLALAWKRTVGGAGQVVRVVGEPGQGASELVADVVALAGGAAVMVTADPQRRHVPYAGLGALVEQLALLGGAEWPLPDGGWGWLASCGDRLPAHLRAWVDDALADARQVVGRTARVDPRTTAERGQAVLAALVAVAATSHWLLAVDDADLLDEASRLVVERLRDEMAGPQRMLLVSHAPGTLPLGPPRPGEVVVDLAPLDPATARELALELAPALRDDVIDRIVRAAAGNPFVLTELLRHPVEGELPDTLHRLGARLLDSLPLGVRGLVRDASILGATVSLHVLADVLGSPDLATSGWWSDAEPVLRVVDDEHVAFRHEAYRRVAYDSLPFRRRRELHGRIADRLATGPEPSDALLATHLESAGRLDEAFPHAVRAAGRAKSAGALAEAADLFSRAASMAPQVDPAAVAELLLEEGEARVWLGDLDGAARCFRSARRAVGAPLVHGRLCHARADLAIRTYRLDEARRFATEGLKVTAGLGEEAGELRCFLLLDLAARLEWGGAHERSARMSREALAWAEQHGSLLMKGLAHSHLEMAYGAMMDARALTHGDAAIRIFEAIGHDRLLHITLGNVGLTAMYLGRYDEAMRSYERAYEGHDRLGHSVNKAMAENNIAFVLLRQGRLEEADERATAALRAFDVAGASHSAAWARIARAQVAAREGRFGDAEHLTAQARAAMAAVGDVGMTVDCDVMRLEHLVLAGRFAEAVAMGHELADRVHLAEPEVALTFGRALGLAEHEVGVGTGIDRIEAALASARAQQLQYEVYQCLSTLVGIADAGGPAVPVLRREELQVITRRLGIARHEG